MPEALGSVIAAKAEGNALFAEEIASFLIESGVVTRSAGAVTFDQAAVTAALPQSVQSILASRVDQLPREARSLLQAAAVIGRRFDPHLVHALTDGRNREGSSFAAMEAADLIHRDERTGDYVFKHVLLRDAIYNRLLDGPRAAMHLKVADELERRSGNALLENAELLAHHFSAGQHAAKAFKYSAMAARKSLNVYAVAEAEAYFRRALATFEKDLSCADPLSAARVVVGLLETMMLKSDYREAGAIAEKFMPLVKEAGETAELVTAYYYQTLSLVQRYDLRAAHELMLDAVAIADRIGDGRARAYARAGLLHCRTRLGLDTFEEAERRKAEVMADSQQFGDNFLRNSAFFFVTWDYLYRGLVKDARAIAIRLLAAKEASGDPRAIGFANWILGWIAVVGGLPEAAVAHADECLRLAIAPFDHLQGEIIKTVAAIFSGRGREGLAQIELLNGEFERLGALYNVLEGPRGSGSDRIRTHLRGDQSHRARDCGARRRRRPFLRWFCPHPSGRGLHPDSRRRPQGPGSGYPEEPPHSGGGPIARRAPRRSPSGCRRGEQAIPAGGSRHGPDRLRPRRIVGNARKTGGSARVLRARPRRRRHAGTGAAAPAQRRRAGASRVRARGAGGLRAKMRSDGAKSIAS